jgi:hypothetical protein
MKRYLISSVAVLLVLALAWIAFGQEQSERAQRRARYRDAQKKAIEVIQEQAGKLKPAFEEAVKRGEGFRNWQDLSEEERSKFREEWIKKREEWEKMIETIEKQLTTLKWPRRLKAEHGESIAELRAIHALAVEEKAEKTTKHLEELIAKRNKEFEDTMEKLGVPHFRRRP